MATKKPNGIYDLDKLVKESEEICERNSIGKNLKHSYYYHP